MEEDTEYIKLPIEDRVQHKVNITVPPPGVRLEQFLCALQSFNSSRNKFVYKIIIITICYSYCNIRWQCSFKIYARKVPE